MKHAAYSPFTALKSDSSHLKIYEHIRLAFKVLKCIQTLLLTKQLTLRYE